MTETNYTNFQANGKTYFLSHDLSLARYKKLEQLQLVALLGGSLQETYDRVVTAYGQLNGGKMADAAVTLNGIIEGVARVLREDEPAILLICTLFYNTADENTATWSEAEGVAKIKEWEQEGLLASFFINAAKNWLQTFNSALYQPTLNTSEPDKNEAEKEI